jgi:PQQ enzyme repeat
MRTYLAWAVCLLLTAGLTGCGQVGVSNSGGGNTGGNPGAVAPAITRQPADAVAALGTQASFSVGVTGTSPLAYQWLRNGAVIPGATGTGYTTPATTSADNGALFSVTVSNLAGSVTSSMALLTVVGASGAAAPAVTAQPANQTVSVGRQATFVVTASGSAPLTYQWRRNGVAISGATAASYTTPAVTGVDNGAQFTVTVTNAAGSTTSNGALLSVVSSPAAVAPAITTQPVAQTVALGKQATFSVTATGTAPLSYQWRKNGAVITGATTANYTTPATTSADNGAQFAVTVSNSAGSVASHNAQLNISSAPKITTQPANQTVAVGKQASFTVVASGTAPLSYQWRKNGVAIAGATAASYTTPATVSTDNGAQFAVTVTNAAGSISSNNALLSVTGGSTPGGGTDVVTYKNDVARTGQNLTETTLTLANVNSTSFGKVRTLATDGKVDAQPLFLSKLTVAGAVHNVVFVATENDSVYAFDANSGATLWKVSLLGPGESPSGTHGCGQVTPTIGVTSTPVIDRSAGAHGTIFVVAMSNSGTDHQRLHALDVTTGAELLGGPTEIMASYAAPAGGGTRIFDPGQYEERAALLLSQGTIYTSWTSHCDFAPYTGWVIAYSEATLGQTAVVNIAPNGTGTGYGNAGPAIWMSGGGPAADAAGNVYLLAGNGAFEPTLTAAGFPTGGDFGNSFVKLTLTGHTLAVTDYFAMSNAVAESDADTDLGSGGTLLLPDVTDASGVVRHLMVGAGKDHNLYVVNRDSMGKFSAASNNIWQELGGVLAGGIWSTPAWFNNTLYYGPNVGHVLAFSLVKARFSATPSSSSPEAFPYPGSSPTISANGTANGIVWAHQNGGSAVLHAYDASNLGKELYNSSQAGSRDQFGAGNKFITPMIADGQVFVGTPGGVVVFGLLN